MKMFEPLENWALKIFMVSCLVSKTGAIIKLSKLVTRSTKPRQLSLRRVLNTATLVLLVKKSTTAVVSLNCAVCDGAFFRNQDLLVVGGGDSAVEEGIYLTRFANSVTIVHRRDELRAQKVLQDRAFANEKVKFIWDSVVEEIKGDDIKVRSVDIKNVKTGEVTNHEFGGVFVYVGLDPVSDYLTGLDITDQNGWVITDDKMATSVPGIFAIGDVRQKDLRQITTAVGEGAIAGIEAYNYVTALGDK